MDLYKKQIVTQQKTVILKYNKYLLKSIDNITNNCNKISFSHIFNGDQFIYNIFLRFVKCTNVKLNTFLCYLLLFAS